MICAALRYAAGMVLMSPELRAQLHGALGSELKSIAPASGGDINDAYRVTLADGRRLFIKANRAAPTDMFDREAAGLEFLRRGLGAARVIIPEVVHVGETFLVLELLETSPGAGAPDDDEALGRGLADIHRVSPGDFGLPEDNFIGTLPQDNRSLPTWAEFYGQRRLQVQADLPGARRLLGRHERRRLASLIERLPELVGDPEPPARLHGDLWAGNWLRTPRGPALIDPAVYGGHREVDLAMMRLFAGFSPRVFSAYEEAFPLAPGHEERVRLYQLYPLLVHLNLFGPAYVGQVAQVIAEYT